MALVGLVVVLVWLSTWYLDLDPAVDRSGAPRQTVTLVVAKAEDLMKEVPKLKHMSCRKAKKEIEALAEEMGYDYEFLTYNFDALIVGLQSGSEFDLIASAMTIKPEREEEIDFSDPYFDAGQSLAVREDATYELLEDLAPGTGSCWSWRRGASTARSSPASSRTCAAATISTALARPRLCASPRMLSSCPPAA